MAATACAVSGGIGRFLYGARAGAAIAAGLALIGLGGLVQTVQLSGAAGWPALLAGLLIAGVGVGLGAPTLASSAMSAVPVQRGGMSAGAVNIARQLGLALGVATLAPSSPPTPRPRCVPLV